MASDNQSDPEELKEAQRNHIRSCIPELVEWTNLSSMTISIFTKRGVLGPGDVTALKSIPNDHERNMEFYKIIQTRLNFYDVLLEAMKKTDQTGVLDLLSSLNATEAVKKSRSSWNPRKYYRLPRGLQEFLDNPDNTICIVPTLEVNITLEKISEHLEGHCVSYECLTEFLRQICPQKISAVPQNPPTCQAVSVTDFAELKNIVDDTLKLNTVKKLLLLTLQENGISLQDHPKKFPSWGGVVEVIHDNMEWDDLSPAYKQHVRSRVKDKFKVDFEEEMNELLCGAVLVQLINGNELKLFKWTIPKQLDYYVERKIITRNVISDNIFYQKTDKPQPHTYLLTGIKRSELSFLSKHMVTGSTREQLGRSQVNAKFMIQDKPIHFDWICKTLEGSENDEVGTVQSVHSLSRGDEKRWRWQKSVGKMEGVQKFIDASQDVLNEDEFVENLGQDSNVPICISDSPGMGKSVLLGQIAAKLIQLHPDREIIFLNIVHFMHQIKEQGGTNNPDSVLKALQNLICENGLAKAVLKFKFSLNEKIAVELLLDGFDELETANYNLALSIISKTVSSFKSVRLWMTSRRHFLKELEDALTILGYLISPFSDEDQTNFLVSYWASNNPALSQDKLKVFSRKCLKKIKSDFNRTDKDIAGIPLQCRLIGEVYEKAAAEFYEIGRNKEPTEAVFQIRSIRQLFEKTIENRFKKYQDINAEDKLSWSEVMESHAGSALEFLFPEYYKKLRTLFQDQQRKEILKVGILETSSNLEEVPHFVHRTYAEYFTAWWVVTTLSSKRTWGHSPKLSASSTSTDICQWSELRQALSDFLFQEVLGCNLANFEGDNSSKILPRSYEFTQNVVTYFLNSLLTNDILDVIETHFTNNIMKPNITSDTWKKLTEACVNADYLQIFKFLMKFYIVDMDNASSIFDQNFLFLAINKSGFEFVELALSLFEKYHPFDRKTQITSLRLGATRGDFSILELFLNGKQLHGLVGEIPELLHECVKLTKGNSNREIGQRITICETLVMYNELALNEKNLNGRTPLLLGDVHIRLIITLIELGADVLSKDASGDTILHLNFPGLPCGRYLSNQEYESLLQQIPLEELKRLAITQGEGGDVPLERLLKLTDPSHNVLQMFHDAGFNFNNVSGDNPSILTTAIKSRRSRSTLQNLIEMGAKTDFKLGQKTLMHLAVESGNVDAVGILLEQQGIDMNAEDENGLTAVDYTVHRTECDNRFETGKLLLSRASKIKKTVREDGKSWLHIYAANGTHDSLHILLHAGIPVDHQDNKGNTPLHFGVKECDERQHNYFDIAKLLLDHGSNPNLTNLEGETPFHVALNNKYLDLETYNLLKPKMDMKWTAVLATPSLRFAVRTANCLDEDEFYSIFRECIEDGADVNYQEGPFKTPLHVAVDKKQLKVVQLLIQKGAHVNGSALHQLQPLLHRAAVHCDDKAGLQILKCLIDLGADVNVKDSMNHTFLHMFAAAAISNPALLPQLHSIVDFLLERGHAKLFDAVFMQAVEELEDTVTTRAFIHRIKPFQPATPSASKQGHQAKFESIVVGSRDCTVSMVIRALQDADQLNLVLAKWSDFARELGFSSRRIRKSWNLPPAEVLHELIEEWVIREANTATLQRLAHAFDVTGLAICAERLRNMATHTIAYRKVRDL